MMLFLRVFVLLFFTGLLSFTKCTPQNVPAQKDAAPVITSTLADREFHVNAGDAFVLNCGAKGSPKPTLKWSKRSETRLDIIIQMPPNVTQRNTTTGIELVFEKMREEDQGKYACTAKNNVSLAVEVFNLKVIFPGDRAPNITTPFKEYTVTAGGVLEMVCQATGNPKPKITWKKHDDHGISGIKMLPYTDPQMKLKSTKLINSTEGLRLQIQNVSKEHQGSYLCKATNRAGDDITTSYLQVQPSLEPPILTALEDQVDMPMLAGDTNTVLFLVFLKNTPIGSTVTWNVPKTVKINNRLEKGERFERRRQIINGVVHMFDEGTAYMYIKYVTHNDAGTYTCTVTTPANLRASRSVTLRVEGQGGPEEPPIKIPHKLPCLLKASSKEKSDDYDPDFVIFGN